MQLEATSADSMRRGSDRASRSVERATWSLGSNLSAPPLLRCVAAPCAVLVVPVTVAEETYPSPKYETLQEVIEIFIKKVSAQHTADGRGSVTAPPIDRFDRFALTLPSLFAFSRVVSTNLRMSKSTVCASPSLDPSPTTSHESRIWYGCFRAAQHWSPAASHAHSRPH